MIDTHTHLDRIPEAERAAAVRRAAGAGVTGIITVGMDPDSSRVGTDLAGVHPGVYAAVGIHPWEAARNSTAASIAAIRSLAGRPRVVAIGEIGLDYENNIFTGESYLGDDARRVQREVMRQQLHIAGDLKLPVIVHARGSHQDVVRLLKEMDSPPLTVIQFNAGTQEDVAAYVAQGCYLCVGGPATDPRDAPLQEGVRAIPVHRLLLETDAPYVPPVWKADQLSEPADVPGIASYIAALTGFHASELIQITNANAQAVFQLS